MKVKATRGICIGVNRHMKAGDIEDLDAATVQFLKSIQAVEEVVEAPPVVVEDTPAPAETDEEKTAREKAEQEALAAGSGKGKTKEKKEKANAE